MTPKEKDKDKDKAVDSVPMSEIAELKRKADYHFAKAKEYYRLINTLERALQEPVSKD